MRIEFLFLQNSLLVLSQYIAERGDQPKTCLSVWPGLIIRTTESIANGAEFINRFDSTASVLLIYTYIILRTPLCRFWMPFFDAVPFLTVYRDTDVGL